MTQYIIIWCLLCFIGVLATIQEGETGATLSSSADQSIVTTPSGIPTRQTHRQLLYPQRHVGRGNNTRMFGGGAVKPRVEKQGNFCREKDYSNGADPSDGQARWLYDVVFHRLQLYDSQTNKTVRPKSFVEFGARDGCKESNTYWLEKNYFWQGILIEAGRDYIEPLRHQRDCRYHNRPGSCVWAALASQLNDTLYWTVSDKALRAPRLNKYHLEERNPTAKDREVKTTTLPVLLDTFRMSQVNLVSADCEGCEFEALLGLEGALGRSITVDVFVIEHPMGERGTPNCTLVSFLYQHQFMAVPLSFSYDYVFLHSSVVQRLSGVEEGLHPLFLNPHEHCYGRNSHRCTPDIIDQKYKRLMACEAVLRDAGTLREEDVPVPFYWLHNSTAGWPKVDKQG